MLMGMVIKDHTFLGENYVLCDTYFKTSSVTFNLEDANYVIKLKTFDEEYSHSNICIPHPFYCLIASTNKKCVNFISLTSGKKTDKES